MIKCVFCAELEDPDFVKNFLGEDWPYYGRMLFSDSNVHAVPGYGPQVFPYAIILTKRHIVSLSETNYDERKSILSCLSFLSSLRAFQSSRLSVFEHGGCSQKGGNGCIDHCHLHVVNGKYDLRVRLGLEHQVEAVKFGLDYLFEGGERYLFTGIYEGGHTINGLIARTYAQSQYFRKILANMVGNSDWNWRIGMNKAYMRLLMESKNSRLNCVAS